MTEADEEEDRCRKQCNRITDCFKYVRNERSDIMNIFSFRVSLHHLLWIRTHRSTTITCCSAFNLPEWKIIKSWWISSKTENNFIISQGLKFRNWEAENLIKSIIIRFAFVTMNSLYSIFILFFFFAGVASCSFDGDFCAKLISRLFRLILWSRIETTKRHWSHSIGTDSGGSRFAQQLWQAAKWDLIV